MNFALNEIETQDGRVAAAPPTLAPGRVVAGQYVVEAAIAADGLGRLYRASDTVTGERVALRVVPGIDDPATGRALLDVARKVRDVRHRNVAAVYAFGEADGDVWTVMQYVRGAPLRERLAAGEMALGDVVRLAGEIAAGLEAAAAQGVLHLDLRPETVIVSPDGHVSLIGFGVAWRGGGAVTTGGGIAERPYLAPELRTAPQAATGAADVYALGRLVSEMLLGYLPERGQRVGDERPDLPKAVDAAIAQALSGPRQRPTSAAAFASALATAAAGRHPAPDAPPRPEGGAAFVVPELPESAAAPVAARGSYAGFQDWFDRATNCLVAKLMTRIGMPIPERPWSELAHADRRKRMMFEFAASALILVAAIAAAATDAGA